MNHKSIQKLGIIIIGLLIVAVIILAVYENFSFEAHKTFSGYKYNSLSGDCIEIEITVNERVERNLFKKDKSSFQIKIENEPSPFDGRHLAILEKSEDFMPLAFLPENSTENSIYGGMIKTDFLKSYIIILQTETSEIYMASLKTYNSIYEMAKDLNCENLLN